MCKHELHSFLYPGAGVCDCGLDTHVWLWCSVRAGCCHTSMHATAGVGAGRRSAARPMHVHAHHDKTPRACVRCVTSRLLLLGTRTEAISCHPPTCGPCHSRHSCPGCRCRCSAGGKGCDHNWFSVQSGMHQGTQEGLETRTRALPRPAPPWRHGCPGLNWCVCWGVVHVGWGARWLNP